MKRYLIAVIIISVLVSGPLLGCDSELAPTKAPTTTPASTSASSSSEQTQAEDEGVSSQIELTYYDSSGKPIAYTEDNTHIYLFSGEPVAYIDNGSVYSFSGRHLGRFENGWIRDNDGRCVFFTEQATGGPMKPIKMMKPMKMMKQMKMMKMTKQMKPMKTVDFLLWSELSGQQFFNIESE